MDYCLSDQETGVNWTSCNWSLGSNMHGTMPRYTWQSGRRIYEIVPMPFFIWSLNEYFMMEEYAHSYRLIHDIKRFYFITLFLRIYWQFNTFYDLWGCPVTNVIGLCWFDNLLSPISLFWPLIVNTINQYYHSPTRVFPSTEVQYA